MLRRVLGSLLVIFGAVAVVLAATGCVWFQLNFHGDHFDLRPVWLLGGGFGIVGASVLGAGIYALTRKPDGRAP